MRVHQTQPQLPNVTVPEPINGNAVGPDRHGPAVGDPQEKLTFVQRFPRRAHNPWGLMLVELSQLIIFAPLVLRSGLRHPSAPTVTWLLPLLGVIVATSLMLVPALAARFFTAARFPPPHGRRRWLVIVNLQETYAVLSDNLSVNGFLTLATCSLLNFVAIFATSAGAELPMTVQPVPLTASSWQQQATRIASTQEQARQLTGRYLTGAQLRQRQLLPVAGLVSSAPNGSTPKLRVFDGGRSWMLEQNGRVALHRVGDDTPFQTG